MHLPCQYFDPSRLPHTFTADVLTTKALDFLDVSKDDERPFFLYLAPCEHDMC